MALKDKLPTLEAGSPDLGGQLRQLLAVVVEICERIEADEVEAETSAEVPEAPAESPEADEAPAVTKPASKPATRASAK